MVLLVSKKEVREIAPWKEATRSGLELVPALIRNAGTRAVESYLCFFSGLASRHTGYVMRAATKRFFQWAEEAGISLDGLRAGHINDFFSGATWKPSTTKFYFGAIKRLFAHLEADRVIDRSPFVGVDAPKAPAREKSLATLEELKTLAREVDNDDEDSDEFRATLVVLYPLVIGGMDSGKIAAFTGINLPEVKQYEQNLRKNGIWTPDNKVVVGSDSDIDPLEIILQVLCALDMIERRCADEPRFYPATT